MNPFLGSLVLVPAEKTLNQLLAKDDYLRSQLAPYAGKTIEVTCSSPALNFTLSFGNGNIKLSAIDSETLGLQADAQISGKSLDLLELISQKSEQRPLANPAIDISGDALLVQDIQQTLLALDMDWEDYLAPFFGDVVTHEIGKLQNRFGRWSQQAKHSMRRNIDDYLKEEVRLVPARPEVDSFNSDLDRLKIDIDRVKAKIERLTSKLNA